MLACARIGAIHSVVFGGFAPARSSPRASTTAKPKVIMSASCGIEPGQKVVAYKPLHRQVRSSSRQRQAQAHGLVLAATPACTAELIARAAIMTGPRALSPRSAQPNREADCVPVKATDPLYVLYTSGTTGQPKGVVRDNGGHMVALHWSMFEYLRRQARARPSGPRRMSAGSSAIPTSSMRRCSHGITSVLFEGKPVGTPDAGTFWRVIAEHGVEGACSPRRPLSARSRRRIRTAST
jgi:propionyl-CoA synthetase